MARARLLSRLALFAVVVCSTVGGAPPPGRTDRITRKIGSMKLLYAGLTARLDPENPVLPKNTPAGVQIVVSAGSEPLTESEAASFFDGPFEVQGELSGPGLSGARTLRSGADPLLLPLPPLEISGDYVLSNVRILVEGKPILDVLPRQAPVRVIEQVLITSVKTRPLTLDELKQRGVVFDGDDFLGFEFTLGMTLESKPVNISFDVLFDREGVPVPQPLSPLAGPARKGVAVDLPPLPAIVPLLLESEGGGGPPEIELPDGTGTEPVRIPSVLVIPGNVGLLKQFFSAQLYVANGAPAGSRLVVKDVAATIELPPGPDAVRNTSDDPLSLPTLTTGVQQETLPVLGVGPDGAPGTTDDLEALGPGEQGQAEFLVRGDKEGFHTLDFDISAILEGLVTGPVKLKGHAVGGVLVRNPSFDIAFTVPSVVRAQEPFQLFVTVHNIGKGIANDVNVTFNDRVLSGLEILLGTPSSKSIDTLLPGDAETLVFDFNALRTGQVVATYLRFDGDPLAQGTVNFTLGVSEGIPLSPDTLVLPSSVDTLDPSLVRAAMRALGLAWSVANAPAGSLPPDVLRIRPRVVIEKALALAEAGLRVELGEPHDDAVRDLIADFFGGTPLDEGFDQLLRTKTAGRELRKAFAKELEDAVASEGGPVPYERETALIAASGPDFLSFAVESPLVEVSVSDGSNRAASEIPGAVLLSNGEGTLGILLLPNRSPYTIEISAAEATTSGFSLTLPRGDGTFVRATATLNLAAGATARITADLFRPDALRLEIDGTETPLATEILQSEGPNLLSATLIGPEVLDGASAFGFHAAALFDRVLEEETASDAARYKVAKNTLKGAKRQLSGRLVFLTLERPEGPYVATSLEAKDIADLRGVKRTASVPLGSKLADPGAVVTGRVFEADGTPVTVGEIAYANHRGSFDCSSGEALVFAEVPLGPDGSYELNYVRRDHCGSPFRILHQDPISGELRDVSGFVRAAGERIRLDIALFGRGSVEGVVMEDGMPAAGASVVVVSGTDRQSGGATRTDGDGRYAVHDIIVGPVSVKAVRGASAGANSGRIGRAGTTAVVPVDLEPGKIRLSGVVSKLEGGKTTPVPGAQVVYSIFVPNRITFLPVGVTRTAANGAYVLEDLPHGRFHLEATLDAEARASIEATSTPGESRVENLIIAIPPPAELGTVKGHVQLPGGERVKGAIVGVGPREVLSGDEGVFEVPGVPVRPGIVQLVSARSGDGKRQGQSSVLVSQAGQVVDGVVITLSGLGSAEFFVRDQNDEAVSGQLVSLLGSCGNLCGCKFATTDGQGKVTFQDLPPGVHFAKAILIKSGLVDVAVGSARIEKDQDVGRGFLRFAGVGTVTGTVFLPGGVDPASGADVALTSQVFNRDSCELDRGLSHRGRTGANGGFTFENVNFGPVSATATHPFADTKVGATATLTKATPVDFRLVLVDTTAGVLSGTVFLPDGVTPAGAGIEVSAIGPLPEVVVRTDDDGFYEFAPIFPQGLYTVAVFDFVTGGLAQEQIYLRAGEDTAHDFRLKGRGTVKVRVVDAAGASVPSAYVKLTESDYPRGVHEGVLSPASDGVITFASVFEGPFNVEARDVFGRDGGRVPSVLPGPDAAIEIQVRLNAVGKVTGHFRMPDAKPIPFGVVKLLSGGQVLGQATTASAGDVGLFTFDYVPIGPIRLEGLDPLTSRQGFATGELRDQAETLTLDVRAQGLGRVEGTITANGFPQKAAHLDLVSGTFRACTTADSDGFYFLEGVPEGRIVATASVANGFLSGTNSGTLIGDGTTLDLDVALRDSSTVIGTVTKAGTSDPAPPSIVTIAVGGSGGGTQSTITDPLDGTFRFERVPAGSGTITVQVLGSIDKAQRNVDVPAGQTLNVTIPLNGLGAISGTALDSNDDPTGGRITLRGTGDFPYYFALTVGPDGIFVLPEVLAGPVTATLEVVEATKLFGTSSGIVLPEDTLDLVVQVEPSGTVKGLVRRPDLAPAAGAEVLIELSGNRGVIATHANDSGEFEVEGVPLGDFDIRASDPFTGGAAVLRGLNLSANGQILDGLVIDLDDSAVRVLTVDPPDGAIDVPTDRVVRVTFSDPVLALNGAFTVRDGNTTVPLSSSLASDGMSATLTGTLPDSKVLTVQVSTALVDVFGRRPLSPFTSTFRTVDRSPPKAIATDPPDDAFEVGALPDVRVTFDEPLSDATDFTSLISLKGPSGEVPGLSERGVARNEAKFTPAAPLEDNARHEIVVMGAVDDLGNTQTTPQIVARFATHDTVAPTLSMLSPQPNAWVGFTRPSVQLLVQDNASGIDPSSAKFKLDAQDVPASVASGRLIFTPGFDLAEGLHAIEASIADRAKNVGGFSGGFGVDVTPPAQAEIIAPVPGAILTGIVRFRAVATDSVSGVARIDLRRSGVLFTSLLPPLYEKDFDTSIFPEGDASLLARAFDLAGNFGPESAPVPVRIDNRRLTLTFQSPPANARVRESVTVRVTASEPVSRVDFAVGTVTASDETSPYEVTLALSTLAEGVQTITATGFGLDADVGSATRDIVVDRTAPAPPNPDLVFAEPPLAGASLVHGRAGAVEARATVDALNLANGESASASAAADGGFAMSLPASVGDTISLTATDDVGNQGGETRITVRSTPPLPPSEGATRLRFEGVVADRVGLTAPEPDSELDAVFTFSLAIGEGVSRTLSYIDLEGTDLRSTRAAAGALLGVAPGVAFPLLNAANGEVSFSITSGATLTLFAPDFGFIQEGETYTATAVFVDGSRFVAATTLVPPADEEGVPHSVRITASPPTVEVPTSGEGTTLLTLEDIRDIEGNPVPDGVKLGIAVSDMATTDPLGKPVRSAGGRILDGEPAASNAAFRLFTISGGSVVASYGSDVVVPASIGGALAVVQVLAADENGNVLGTEAIGTLDLNLRAGSDKALVSAEPASLYGDKRPRQSAVRVQVRNNLGVPVPDGTRVLVSAAFCASRIQGFCVSSHGGTILGGADSPSGTIYRLFEVAGGEVMATYQLPTTQFVGVGAVSFATIQVLEATADGRALGGTPAIGTAAVSVVGPADAEIDLSPESVPLVSPPVPVQVRVRHVHDSRGNLVPEDATLLLSATFCATRDAAGFCVPSAGGIIVEGPASPSGLGLKVFSLTSGVIHATYQSTGVTAGVGTVQTANVQVGMGDSAGSLLQQRGVTRRPLSLLAPANAVGVSDPPSLLAVGERVVASAAPCGGRDQGGFCIPSVSGAQILNGAPAAAGPSYRLFTIENGAVSVQFGDEGITASVGQTKEANVILLQSGPNGELLEQKAIAAVPIPLVGVTSATVVATPTMLEADGTDRRASITVSNIRDALGNPVPDGTRIGLSASFCATRIGGFCIIPDVSATIVGGEATAPSFRTFTVRASQIVGELSTLGITVASGSKTAIVQVAAMRPNGTLISQEAVATAEVELVPAGADRMAAAPVDLFADGSSRLSSLTFSLGSVPNGSQVALTVSDCAATDDLGACIPSTGGTILTGGTMPSDGAPANGDPRFRLFTVTGGQVKAAYSAEGQKAGVGESPIARISVVPADGAGNVTSTTALVTGEVRLRGMTFAIASGPATLPLVGGEATITFSGIRDAIGNTVPDGTMVLVTAAPCGTFDEAGLCNDSASGTLLDGSPSVEGPDYRAYSVTSGSVSVTYSTSGASLGVARIQMAPAASDGTLIGTKSLLGGVHKVTLE